MPVATGLNTGQVTLGTTATAIVPLNPTRTRLTIYNVGGSAAFLGGATVSATTGVPLPASVGAAVTVNTAAALYGIVTTGTEVVSYLEEVL
jgi:hypothetical protein